MPTTNTDIDARPTKKFFIQTLVKDVVLSEAIFDLVDNSIDGFIRNSLNGPSPVTIRLSPQQFCIEDECGGIPMGDVTEHVFRFGGQPQRAPSGARTIGSFGIGLKRAIFKMGESILLESDDGVNEYSVLIDKAWLTDEDNWRLKYKDVADSSGRRYTRITISDLFPNVAEQLDTREFENRLASRARMTYTTFLDTKIVLSVNEVPVHPLDFQFINDAGRHFHPLRRRANLDGVDVEVYAGNTDPNRDPDRLHGWYVFCNNRLVLAGDTTYRTGWDDLLGWKYHYPQDDYFLGLVFFGSDDPAALPWDTGKTDVQDDSKVYRSAQVEMRQATDKFVKICRQAWNLKHADTGETIGRTLFTEVKSSSYRDVDLEPVGEVPIIEGIPVEEIEARLPQVANVLYTVKLDLARRVKDKLGDAHMSHKAMGLKTFHYFAKMEEVPDE